MQKLKLWLFIIWIAVLVVSPFSVCILGTPKLRAIITVAIGAVGALILIEYTEYRRRKRLRKKIDGVYTFNADVSINGMDIKAGERVLMRGFDDGKTH